MTPGGWDQDSGQWREAPPDEVTLIPPDQYGRYEPVPPQHPTGWSPPLGPQARGYAAPGWDQRPRRRTGLWIAVTAVVVVVLVVAFVNLTRHSATQAGNSSVPTGAFAPSAGPTPGPSGGSGSNGSGGTGGAPLPAVSCPLIRDEESHLSYRCIDNYLVQDSSDTYLGIRIALNHEVEPGWIISEGSGNPLSLATPPPAGVAFRQPPASPVASQAPLPTTAQVQAEVARRTDLALVAAYGSAPSPATLSSGTRRFGTVTGFELVTEVTINPAYRVSRGLKVKKERLWVVGLPTAAGISVFIMSIPDERSDLWAKAEATVATITVI